MLAGAVRGAGSDVCVLGVTRLTSDEAEPQDVVRLARLAAAAGCGGVVCAGTEASEVREAIGAEAAIRPRGVDAGDQRRVVTPETALRSGASHVVIGRAVRDAPEPEVAACELLEEIEKALKD